LFFLKEAIINFFKNKTVNFLGLIVVSIAIVVVIIIFLILKNFNLTIAQLKSNTNIVMYLSDNLKAEDILFLQTEFSKNELIKNVNYFSKEKAFQLLKKETEELPEIIEGLPTNPLPAYFEIYLVKNTLTNINAIKTYLEKIQAIESIDYGQNELEYLNVVTKVLNFLFICFFVIACVSSIFIIFNTIKLTVFTRKIEIHIQKLVGATAFFIRLPFLIEGIIFGGISGTLGISFSYLLYSFSKYKLKTLNFFDFNFIFLNNFEILVSISICIFLGLFGSYIAVSKFLNYDVEDEDF
jgi:cell division transport system permease protein